MTTRTKTAALFCVLAGFLVGVLFGLTLSEQKVDAAQKFGPKDVKSVPKSFIEGGDKTYIVLKSILKETQENGRRMEDINKAVAQMNDSVKEATKNLDATNKLLSAKNRR
ncbi:hypothetical protein ACFL1X_08055 [Candidatus Hydrogenedentota bacterium]